MMEKRTIQLDGYDTAVDGLWTLHAWSFPEPEPSENFVTVPGRFKGPLDMSTDLTDGVITYGPRPLSIELESSEGSRLEREERISELVNRFHGQHVGEIIFPDDFDHYATGRLKVKKLYNDPAHGAVQIAGVCEPWRYASYETTMRLTASTLEQEATLTNNGTMPVMPRVVTTAEVTLSFFGSSLTLSAGTYELPDLLITAGSSVKINYKGAGDITFTYREAVL